MYRLFLIGHTFAWQTQFGVFVKPREKNRSVKQLVVHWANICFINLVQGICQTATKLCSGSKKHHSTCFGNIRPVRQTLPLIGCERRLKDSYPVDGEEIEIEMDDYVSASLALEGTGLFVDLGRRSLVSGTQHHISWIIMWGIMWRMIKVRWLSPTFWIMLSSALPPQVWAESCVS